jgi:hypothetical protein
MMDQKSLVLLYRAVLDMGKQKYEVLDFFTSDKEFEYSDYWSFYEKKYLLTSRPSSRLSFESYDELEAFAGFVGSELSKDQLLVLDNLIFNQAIYHADSMDQALDHLFKNSKKIDIDGKKGLKSGVFGRIFRT